MPKLGDICVFQSGGTPSRSNASYYKGEIPWITTVSLTGGIIGTADAVELITEQAIKESAAKFVPAYSIMVGTRVGVGKVAINSVPMSTSQDIISLLSIDEAKWNKEFLCKFIIGKSPYLNSQARGATIKGIKIETLANLEVPDISLDEQKHIAHVLNEVNTQIHLRASQLEELDKLVKSRFIELFGIIKDTVPLAYYISALSAGKSLAGEEASPNKVLKTGAATYDYFDPTQVKNLPIDYTPIEEHRVKTGDVIISRMNTAELVGAAAYVWTAPSNTYLPDRLWRAEIKDNANPIFVWQLLIQSSTKENIRRIASGTSGSMKNISKLGLLGISVKKVDISAQNEFAAFVEHTYKLKLAVSEALEELETLKKSLMQQYFG